MSLRQAVWHAFERRVGDPDLAPPDVTLAGHPQEDVLLKWFPVGDAKRDGIAFVENDGIWTNHRSCLRGSGSMPAPRSSLSQHCFHARLNMPFHLRITDATSR